ncbi:hypothetical protein AB3S75_012237 [Citrus x aurantiifolia]
MSFNAELIVARKSSTRNEDKRQVVDRNGGKRKTKQSEEWVMQSLLQELGAKFSSIDSFRKSQLKNDGLNWDSEEAKEIYAEMDSLMRSSASSKRDCI